MNREDISRCTGCRACEQICPRRCISMRPDPDGFYYPHIDTGQCVKCGLCEQYCPIHFFIGKNEKKPSVYAAWLKDSEKLASSSSGGAFTALAEYVLSRGGCVFGCVFDKNMRAVQMKTESEAGLARMRGSKYVQSDTGDTFLQAKRELEKGVLVLYVGTPCQIAGLKAFLHRDAPNLITVDLICHGVPSPGLFGKYVRWQEQKTHSQILSYRFRDKSENGWSLSGEITGRRKNRIVRKRIVPPLDPYYWLFLKGDVYRESCYTCAYANSRREGDFTIGDFWGIERIRPELPAHGGISLLMVNSAQAKAVFPEIFQSLSFVETTFEQASAENSQLMHPVLHSTKRGALLAAARGNDFGPVVVLWRRAYRKEAVLFRLKQLIPKTVKKSLKMFLKSRIKG